MKGDGNCSLTKKPDGLRLKCIRDRTVKLGTRGGGSTAIRDILEEGCGDSEGTAAGSLATEQGRGGSRPRIANGVDGLS